MPDVVVIDYGLGNLLSVRRGLEHWGASVEVTGDHDVIRAAPRVVLPGVGAFREGMAGLRRLGLDAIVREVSERGTPLLAICLGMQMLMEESSEHGATSGLGLISGCVVPIRNARSDGQSLKVPHIGWNALERPAGRASWRGTMLEDIPERSAVYFVHSFMAAPAQDSDRLAECEYGGGTVCAAIGRGNTVGCQFHPEKSGQMGLLLLKTFLSTRRSV